MKKFFTALLFLHFSFTNILAQQASEQEVNAQIQQARSEVDAAQSAVNNSSQLLQQKTQQLQQLRNDWNKKQEDIKIIQEKIASVDNTLAKSVEHIDQEIKRSQDRLAALKRNNAEQDEIDQAQREVTAYQNMKNNRLRKSSLNTLKAGYQRLLTQNEADLNKLRPRLQSCIDSTKIAEDQFNDAQGKFADAQLKLANILQKAPDMLGYINPPYLKKVSARGESSGTYEADWNDYSKIIDEQIDIIKRGIEEQKKMIEAYKKLIEENSNQLMEQQNIANEKLDAYVHEVQTWSWIKSSLADLTDAAINIARNFKEMGPYAFAYEAVYRVAEAAVYTQPSDWDITKLPTQPNAPIDVTSTAGNFGIAITKDQVKGLINQALQAYIGTSEFGIPGSGLHYGTEATIGGAKEGFRKLINEGKFWVVADKELNAKWMARLTDPHFKGTVLEDVFATLKRSPKAFLENFKSSFNKERLKGALLDLAQSTAIQALKEWLDQKRLNLWSDYLIEDQKRTELLNSLKYFGAQRQRQQVILEALNEKLQELIKDKEDQANKPTRYLKVNVNDEVHGSSCNLTLEFSSDVQVDSVVLQGKRATGSVNKNIWTGKVDISGMKDDYLAQLVVAAKGPTTQKILDDPNTAAQYAATTESWTGYEPKDDRYHKIKLKPLQIGTSIVLLIDCSGSMNDNNKIQKAINAATNVLSSKQFGEYDEIAIMTFNGCGGASILQSFTNDYELLKQKVKALYASGDTPLAASMKQASFYLESSAHNKYRKLIVLTDGQESCGGNEFEALQTIWQFHQNFVKLVQ